MAPPRRTQAQRRETTRSRILDATVQCLVERGYAETTTSEVLALADVPRGTLLHHFPTKVDLLVAAVQHLSRRRLDALSAELATVPAATGGGTDQVDALIDILWRHFSSPLFWAALELWTAARTDADLRAALMPVENEVFGVLHEQARHLLEQSAPGDPRLGHGDAAELRGADRPRHDRHRQRRPGPPRGAHPALETRRRHPARPA